jgi:hypothetical protein
MKKKKKKNLVHVNVIANLTYMKGILTNFPLSHQQYQISTIIENPNSSFIFQKLT